MAENDVEIYKAQTLAVESLLDHHPEFDPAVDPQFTADERQIFAKVFQPDWAKYGDDYHQVFNHFVTNDPELMRRAQEVIEKFWLAHGVDPTGLELAK